MEKTNWLAILAAAIAGFGIGFLWYGVLFQDTWMAGNGITMEGETMLKHGKEVAMSATPMIVNTVGMVLLALIMNWLMNKTNHTTLQKGAMLGLVLGLVATINIVLTNLFAQNSMSLTIVDSSYIIVLLTVMGIIIGAWRKK